jgi:hypothetical protein
MPRFANVVGRPEAEAGAATLNRIRGESVDAEHEQRIMQHEALAEQIELSNLRRQQEKDRIMAERKQQINAIAPTVLKEIHSINPADDDALTKLLKVGVDHPEAFDGELGDKDLLGRYNGMLNLAKETQARKQQMTAHQAELSQKQQERQDILGQQQDFRRDMAADAAKREVDREKQHQAEMRETRLGAARDRYTTASELAEEFGDRVKQNQRYIDELAKRETVGQGITPLSADEKTRLAQLRFDHDSLQEKQRKYDATLKGLTAQFPELDPNYKPPADQTKTGATTQTGTKTPTPPAAPEGDGSRGAASPPTPASESHPFEGKRVRQKSTGKYGTFVNGQFVPES